ncbi:autotransporter-associated beta strand repeat-containing protein [Pseudomonas sp. NPDC090202]|uniref:autotransporter-associated beta strand repeat-containing protein n=1 Tax=unclassified Pseudomonas TaxID=196821 RepID=UPI00383022AE
MALNVQNGAGGTTNIFNAGTISSNGLLGITLLGGDAPLIAAWGGAQVNMVNTATGKIIGRVAFERSNGGNTFINAGEIVGSVSMGQSSTNTFTAVTGSSVSSGGGVGVALGNLLGLNLGFAATGIVDGGAGGNNTLVLRNSGNSGSTGTGTISSANYINFNNLTLNSGTWTLQGPVVSGSSTLNGGLAQFDSATTFGSGLLTSNGGSIQALNSGLTLGNQISLGTGGLTVAGANALTLGGVIAGTGPLIKTDGGVLSLIGNNTFSGGTTLAGGGIRVGTATALGSGALNVTGAGSLDNSTALALSNNVNLGANLTVTGSNALTLNGVIAGASNLIKTGGASLTLGGNNTWSGGTSLNAGSLILASNTALGTGALNAAAGTTLDTSLAVSVGNAVSLAGAVNIGGSNDLGLTGVVSGAGSLVKNGAANLLLNGANTYSGGTTLNSGTLTVGNNAALGSGALTVGGASALVGTGSLSLTNNVALNANLALNNVSPLALGGVISGAGGLIKNGSGTLSLNGLNTFAGGTTLNAGTLALGNASALGTGGLTVAGAGALTTSAPMTLNNNVALNANLTLNGSSPLSLGGVVSGTGALIKNGASVLTLAGNNSYSGGTSLNAGGLLLSSNTALGTGALNAADGTTLDASTAVALNNALNLAGSLAVGGGADLTLNGVVGGPGALVKNGAANLILNTVNAFAGGTTLNAGTLTLGNAAALGTGALAVGGTATLANSLALALNNNIALNGNLNIDGSNPLTLNGVISGASQLIKNGNANLTLNGNNTWQGGTLLNGGTLTAGNAAALGTGALTVGGAATLDNSAAFSLGNAIHLGADLSIAGNNNLTLGGVIDGNGALIKNGLDDLTLSGSNSFTGPLNILAGSVTTTSAGALGNSSGANIASGAVLNLGNSASLGGLNGSGLLNIGGSSTLTVGGGSVSSAFDGAINGTGGLTKTGSGVLDLNGVSTLTGNTLVSGGTLNVDGSLASANVTVNSGATLSGTGALLGAVNVANGGHLSGTTGSTLSLGSLVLNSGSNLDVGLGAPVAGGGTRLINVNGNLTLDGKLNVSDLGGFGVGVYRLIDYGGSLIDLGLDFGSIPANVSLGDLLVQTSIGGQVNLVVGGASSNIRFWDGSQTTANGSIDGGSGTWGAGTTNWTSANGSLNQAWASDFAVFQGTAGNVSVQGTQSFTGLQFLTDGYTLSTGAGGQLTAVDGSTGNTAIRVDPNVTATIGVGINGSGTLNKLDSGTLVLNGNNSYSGGTLLNGGTLVVGNNNALGSGTLTTATGTTLDSNTATTLNNAVDLAGNLTVGGSNALTLAGTVSGAGSLIKNGAASLTLSGNNSYLGPTALNAGGLILASNTALGTGALNAAANTTLDASTAVTVNNAVNLAGNLGVGGTADLTLGGVVSGAGSLTKNGAAQLILNASNSYSGGTTLNAGKLVLGNAGALGTGALNVAGTSTLENSAAFALGNALNLGANLTLSGNNDLTLGGAITGTGDLSKTGTGNLILSGNNSFSGALNVLGGTLTTVNGNSLGNTSGANISAGALLNLGDNTSLNSLTGAGNVQIGAGNALSLGGSNLSNTFDGSLNGGGNLIKNGTGTLNLTGSNGLNGNALVNAGTLNVGGSLASANVAVGNGATLTGNGSLAGAVSIADGGHLSGMTGNTLSLGSLVLSNNANLDVALGAPVAGGGTRLFNVGGNLTLDGKLNVSDLGGFGVGVYRLIDYTGSLTDLGLDFGSLPAGVSLADLLVQTGVNGQVNLVVSTSSGNLRFWDGSQTVANGAVDGGSGVWGSGSNWTSANGLVNQTWANDFAVFQGAAGTITVEGNQSFTGLQFLSDGYNLNAGTNGQLTAVNGSNGYTAVRVDPNVTATLGVGVTGSATLNKLDSGTLVLNGASSYSGGTLLNGGTLLVGDNSALGSGALTAADGTTLGSNSTVALNNAVNLLGNLNIGGSSSLTLNGLIGGVGSLSKNGATSLILNNANTYNGGTSLNAGSLILGNAGALGTGALTVAGASTLDNSQAMTVGNVVNLNADLTLAGSNDLGLSGTLNGSGGLIKNGNSTLSLSGSNGYTGNTLINHGTLNVGGSLASANVNVASGATLAGNGSLAGAVTVADGGHLSGASGSTLSLGSLVLGSNANLDVGLGAPVAGGGTRLFNVGGNLTLDGKLNVSDLGGFGVGVYRLIDYTGSLTDLGLDIGSIPANISLADLLVQTGVNGQVNLVVSGQTGNLRFWDGSQTVANGTVDGGSGVWGSGTNWTSANGTVNQTWGNDFAVFQGTAGTVSVEGTQTFTGLQFLTDGYNLVSGTAGQLNAVNGSAGYTAVRVDPNVTATIGANIGGTGTLNKLDSGTLVLNGANTYSGGTLLNGGTLVVGNNAALGASRLTAADGTTLDSNTAVALGNAVDLAGNLTIAGSSALALNGDISGVGGLTKNGAASLTLGGNNSYLGPIALNAGGLILASNTALGSATLNAAANTTLDASTAVTANNAINLAGNLGIGGSADLTLNGVIAGAGGLTKNGAAQLVLNGANTYSGGTVLNGGTLTLGNSAAVGSGAVTVSGTSTLQNSAPINLANALNLNANLTLGGSNTLGLNGDISGTGGLIKNGASDLTLSGNNSFSGALDILAGSVSTTSAGALGNTSGASIASGAQLNLGNSASLGSLSGSGALNLGNGSTLTLGGSNLNNVFDGAIGGAGGLIKAGTGALVLNGANTYAGDTQVNAGVLNVAGSLSSANVNVNSGGTLTGTGSLTSAVSVADGGHLSGRAGSTLSMGSLAMSNNANLDVGLGAPAAGGGNRLFYVNGNLTLDGTLNVTDLGGFGVGVYRLIDYTGSLTNNGLGIGVIPVSVMPGDLSVQTAAAGQINLVVSGSSSNLGFWDGNQTVANGLVDGGTGTWGTGTNWTSADGTQNQTWGNDFAVFQGTAGTVSVVGAQSFTGLQFLTDNYHLIAGAGGTLTAVNGSTGYTAMRVDPNVTATLDVAINGSGTLNKLDSGTLVLNGANSYSGGTLLNGGALVVGNDSALGSGALTAANGTVLDSNKAVTLNNAVVLDGALTVAGSNTFALGGVVSGTGGLIKSGNQTLYLDGANTYQGGTTLNGGTLVAGSNTALGSGGLSVAAPATLDSDTAVTLANGVSLLGDLTIGGSNALALSGVISGAGKLIKNGVDNLTLSGTNTWTGGTDLNSGTLTLDNASALGTGVLNANGTATLDNTSATALGNNVNVNGSLTVAGNNNLALSGVLGGAGNLIKDGLADLTLAGSNTFNGVLNILNGSVTTVGNAALSNASGASLNAGSSLNLGGNASIGTLSGQGSVVVGSGNTLTLGAGNLDSTFDGSLDGSGHLDKSGSGVLTLTGVNSLSGVTQVDAGTLNVTGSLASASVGVNNGATLTGSGALLGSVNIGNGGHLLGSSGSTLSTGSLVMSSGANLDVGLAAPSATRLIDVNGNLTLDGNLNVTDLGGFGIGVYRLIDYTGSLTDLGLDFGSLPPGVSLSDLAVQTGVNGQVNLVVSGATSNLLFWDGSQTTANGVVDGGNGVWGTGSNWTTLNGATNQAWTEGFAVFQGAAGTVTVDGNQSVSGLQFLTDGYVLDPGTTGQLTAVNGSGGNMAVRVNPNVTATIDTDIVGTATLNKLDAGTLVLNGNNTYSGDTLVNGGTLNVGGSLASADVKVNSGATLTGVGSLTGTVNVADGGHLRGATGSTLSMGGLVLGSNANLDVALGAPVAGGGTRLFNVGGDLTLDGNLNVTDLGGFGIGVYRLIDYTGSLTDLGLDFGSLPPGVNLSDLLVQTGVNGQVNLVVSGVNNNLRFWDGSETLPNGKVDGGSGVWGSDTNWTSANGTLNSTWADDFAVFQGTAGTVTVEGNQNFTGLQFLTNGYVLNAGTSGQLTAVDGSSGYTAIRVNPSVTATINTDIGGAATLNKLDAGTLVLNGNNTYTGDTLVNGGTLNVGGSLASASVNVNSGATLTGNGTLAGTVTVADDGHLSGATGRTLTMGGLLLSSNTNLDVALGAPVVGGGTRLFNIGGDLTLDGKLNVSNLGGFGVGVYRLIDYTGNLSDLGLDIGSLPAGVSLSDLVVQTSVTGQVNLVVSGAASNLLFWDGSQTTANGTVDGGTGTWGTGTNWTTANGSSNQTWSGDFAVFQGTAGTVTVAGNQSFTGLQFLTDGYVLNSGIGGQLTAVNGTSGNTAVRVDPNVTATINANIVGSGTLNKLDSGTLVLGGTNTYSGGTLLGGGTLSVGNAAALGSGALTVNGAGTLTSAAGSVALGNNITLNNDLTVSGANDLTLSGVISGLGGLIKNGLGDLTLSGNNTFSGLIDIVSGSLSTVGSGALGNNAGIHLANGAALNLGGSASLGGLDGSGLVTVDTGNTLTVGGNDLDSTYGGNLSGNGALVKIGRGVLRFTALNSIVGNTSVNGGTLDVDGSLASALVTVNNGATLTGSGTLLGAVNIADGGHLAGRTGSTLTTGSLVLAPNANFDAALGAPVAGGGNALVSVNGNLTLDGTLNVTDIGGFGAGIYRLMNYTGGLTNNGLALGTLPVGVTPASLQVQTAVGNQINLVVTAPGAALQFWDGSQTSANGVIDGGSGVWDAGSTNWTSSDGTVNQNWQDDFAVFTGAAGTVTVEGAHALTGMQFASDGYTLEQGAGGELTAVNGSGGAMAVRVDPNVTATINTVINGSGTLNKLDSGTLVLNAANGYTGGTTLNGGTLVVGNDSALGSGVLTAANGSKLANNRSTTLSNNVLLNGALAVGGSSPFALAGVISGTGSLVKVDGNTLYLNGSNTYSGGTQLNAGTLVLGNDGALGSGALSVTGASTLDSATALQLANAVNLGSQLTLAGNQNTTLNGVISGAGSLVKNGNGSLLLSGANSYTGGTLLNGGSTTGNTSSLQGSILNNAALTFAQSANGTYAGSLTGSGSLIKSGTGELLLTGANGFTGNTDVQAGSLRVNGSLNSASVNVANGATLAGSGQIAGAVQIASGATLAAGGGATPLSVGSLALVSGSNLNFALGQPGSSTTLVNVAGNLVLDGTLNLSAGSHFGKGVYQLFRYGGSLTDNGLNYGTLPSGVSTGDLTLQTAIANQVNLLIQDEDNDVVFWNGNQSADGTINGGSGVWGPDTIWTDSTGMENLPTRAHFAVFAARGGVVTVLGNQRFTGLQFLDNGYSLVAGTNGSLTPVNNADGSLAPVRVNADVTTELSVPLVGDGGIEKFDAGTLLLTGANTYSGGTTVSGGTLAGNTTSLQGRILNNARMLFAQNVSGRFNGTLSGTGSIIKQGAGTLLLTGNQPFSGSLAVEEGVLQVGEADSPATLAAQVAVSEPAAVVGNGSIASLDNTGLVQSGGDLGNLSVAGNFINASTGRLRLLVAQSRFNALAIAGTANLGGTLEVVALEPFTGNSRYRLLTADGGITGTFSTLDLPDYAFLDSALSYSTNAVDLSVTRNDAAFVDVAATRNQQGVAAALDRNLGSGVLQNQILNLTRGEAQAAYDSLSGEIFASTTSAMLEDSHYVRDAVTERMRQPGCYREDDPANALVSSENRLSSAGCNGEMVGWMRVLGSWGEAKGDNNTAKLDHNVSGFMLGTDKQVDDQLRVGGAAGYTRSDLDAHDRRSSATVESYHLAAYMNYQFTDALAARMGAAYSWHDIESKRDVSVGSYNERMKANYNARTAQVFGEVGYTFDVGGVSLEPFAGLAYVNYDSDQAKEKGKGATADSGAARLKADSDQDITFSTVGVRAGKRITLNNGSEITPRGSIGWRHAFGETKPDADLTFVDGGASFSTQGVPIARDAAVVEAGLDFKISENSKLGIGYSGQLSSENKDHAMTINFSMGF